MAVSFLPRPLLIASSAVIVTIALDRVASPTRPATTVVFAFDTNGHLVKQTGEVTTDSFRPQFKSP
jgi:hypothetical protein